MFPPGEETVPASSENNLRRVLNLAVGCLQSRRTPYALIGAWALAAWGKPRATLDLDFLVMADEEDLGRLGSRMGQLGMNPDRSWLQYNPLLRGLQLRLRFRDVVVDLLRPRDAHDRQVFRRTRRRRLAGRYYRLVSPEDFILQKLKVGRPRDFEDAVSVLERLGKALDRRYLERWARKIGVTAELHYVLSL